MSDINGQAMIDGAGLIELIRPGGAATEKAIDRYADISLLFELVWHSENAVHTDCHFQRGLNLWQDFFPPELDGALTNKSIGDSVVVDFTPGQLLAAFEDSNCIDVDVACFKAPLYRNMPIQPAAGRFYPKRFIAGTKGIDQQDITPMRVTDVGPRLSVDLNHPLADRELSLNATVIDIAMSAKQARGGLCRDIGALITDNGPGMQARWKGQPTDFWIDSPYARDDENPDKEFYRQPRLVNHIDTAALGLLGALYRQWLPGGARVLDLLASWDSHLPDSLSLAHVTGLGMNEEELSRNLRLNDFVIHDLNEDCRLPFDASTFDAVICTVSVEYLTEPLEVFAEVSRVLRPHGRFIVTFSNRWFPPKAIRIWELLHDYERMGLVLEYFLLSGKFSELGTWSMRGLPRPGNDKYSDRLSLADPVYAVCGTVCA